MSNEFQRRLRQLRTTEKRIVPDAAWVRATRATLLMQARNTMPAAESVTLIDRMRGAVKALVPQNMGEWMRRPLIVALSLVVVLAGGSMMSVSAAEQALPGDLLYSLKLATEQARLAFTPVKEERLKLKSEFTSRRVDELKQVADDSEHPDRVVQVAEILKRDLDTLKQQLDDVAQDAPGEKTVAAAKLVDQQTTDVMNALQQTKSQLSPENVGKVTEVQSAAADTGVKAIEVLAEQHRQSNDVVPAEDVAKAINDHVKTVTDVTSSTPATIVSTSTNPIINGISVQALADIVTSSTISTTTSALPTLIGQVKDATAQAFAQQKAKDQLEVAAAASGTDAVLPTATSSTEAASSSTSSALIVPTSSDALIPPQTSSDAQSSTTTGQAPT